MRVTNKKEYSYLCLNREIAALKRTTRQVLRRRPKVFRNPFRRHLQPKSPGGGIRGFRKREAKRLEYQAAMLEACN